MIPSSQTSVVLHGLEEDVSYGVMIQGVTADGQEGPSSEPAFGTPLNRSEYIWESLSQFENRIMPRVYKRSITHSTMYQKAPFC